MSFQKAKSLDELNLLIEKAKAVEKARQLFNEGRVSSGIDAPSTSEANLAKQQEVEATLGRLLGPQQKFFSQALKEEEDKKREKVETERLMKEEQAREEEAIRIEEQKAREERERIFEGFKNDIQAKALSAVEDITIDDSVKLLTSTSLLADDGLLATIMRDSAKSEDVARLSKVLELYAKLNYKDSADQPYLKRVQWDVIQNISRKLGITKQKDMKTSSKGAFVRQYLLPALQMKLDEAVEREAFDMYDESQRKAEDSKDDEKVNDDGAGTAPPPDQEGFGLKRKKNHGFKVNVNDGSFGDVFINLPKLIAELKLEVMSKQDKKIMSRKVQPDFIDMLLKRYNPKKKYDPSTIETFKQLVSLAKLPLYGEHSTKLAIINPDMKKPQRGGCPGTIMIMKVPEAVKKIPVLIGEIEAGNNNPLVKNQLSELVQFLVREGKMSKADGAEIINEYVLG